MQEPRYPARAGVGEGKAASKGRIIYLAATTAMTSPRVPTTAIFLDQDRATTLGEEPSIAIGSRQAKLRIYAASGNRAKDVTVIKNSLATR